MLFTDNKYDLFVFEYNSIKRLDFKLHKNVLWIRDIKDMSIYDIV